MTRLLTLFVLLGASAIVLAEPLYKWKEADGSITFSLKPPPAGIKYETVTGSAPEKSDTAKATTAAKALMAPTAREALPEGSAPVPTQTLAEDSAPLQKQPMQRIAPKLGAQVSNQRGIQRSTASRSNPDLTNEEPSAARGVIRPIGNAPKDDSKRIADMVVSSRKQRQCEDLKKRVVSLEGRLRNRLTPEDMDNTVVHIARYQRSYDQHCVQ